MRPFLSIVTVTRNDAWALTKTARSVFRQSFKDFEYIVVDGASTDSTAGLVEYWQAHGLVNQAISEPDTGVYNGMNKGLRLARGEFVCFMNASDVFASDDVLAQVHALLQDGTRDGVLGWGALGGQVWASWIEHEAFKLASLGFCHQALFVRRTLLLEHPFEEMQGKTDSDTLQLGRMLADGARIDIVPEVWAVRGAEPGISANLERTRASIIKTLVDEYAGMTEETAAQIVAFRRQCKAPQALRELLVQADGALRTHLAYMVLDTLFLRQSMTLDPAEAEGLFDSAQTVLAQADPRGAELAIERLLHAQGLRRQWLESRRVASQALKAEITMFRGQESTRLAKLRASRGQDDTRTGDFVVSLTSFPARIPTLEFVIRSLLEQSCRPREIHLWLGADEVPARHWLPRALLDLEPQGLRIHFARSTCHQYDKFLHNAELNQDLPFVIVDDDVIYPPDAMASLIEGHRSHPGAIVANRCHLMNLTADGGIAPYKGWQREVQFSRPSLRAFPTGAGGVLYPRGFMNDPMVTQVQDILAIAPYADDIWLKACAIARNVPTMSTALSQGGKWYLRYTPTMREGALHATNVDLGLNDLQLQRAQAWLSQRRPDWQQALLGEVTA
jgi:hypothetical protein